jgi:hypothetical protein
MAKGPTKAQVHAVQKALYEPARLKHMRQLRMEISLAMNLNQEAQLPPTDVRYPAGSGPQWFYPDTGDVDDLVLQGAHLCDQMAHALLAIRADVAKIDFPASDKHHMMAGIQAEAASWSARGRAWRAASKPDVEALVAGISGHLQTGIAEAAHVQHYFKPYLEVVQ